MSRLERNQVISALGLNVYRGTRTVVKDISFQMKVGDFVAVLGANGAGKSSLLCALAGECADNGSRLVSSALMSGALIINGSDLMSINPTELAKIRAVLPQHSALTFNLSVDEVVRMGAYPYPEAQPEQINQWVAESLRDADLEHLCRAQYSELSGGEQQRVQFARVLVQARAIVFFQGHAWIFLDEPTASLDPRHQQLLMQKIHALVRTSNFGVMVVMHDLNLAANWCDRVILMKEGTFIADDCPVDSLTTENLSKCFDMPMLVMPHPLNLNQLIVMPA